MFPSEVGLRGRYVEAVLLPAPLAFDFYNVRLAGLRIPDNRRLALVGDADTGNVQSVDSQ